MKATFAIAAVMLLAGMAPIQERYQRAAAGAQASRESGDIAGYLRQVREIFQMLPGHPGSRLSLARALSLSGQRSAALQELSTLADQGFGYDTMVDPAFASLRKDFAFLEVNRRLADNRRATGRTPTGTDKIGLPGRRPEGIAALSPDGPFVVGTWDGDIFAVGETPPRPVAHGKGMVAGIRPDPATGTFLACYSDAQGGTALVQHHRMADGALLAMYPLPASGAFCNDISLTDDGGFVVTESNGGRIYRLHGHRLQSLPIEPLFYPNGIATDPVSGRIYIAHGNGISVFDPKTGSSAALAAEGTVLGGIDGLVWHQSGLLALQNVTVPARLLRIGLTGLSNATVEPLMTGSPLLEGATTLAVRAGEAYILSHTGIPTGEPPNDPILVRVPL